jgi:proline-specific peptidase
MADTDMREGTVPFKTQHIDTPCHTYYKIIGDLSSNSPRLVVLHGGPGTGHEYLLPYSCLWHQFGTPVVFYDQIGCAASTHLRQTAGDESFWQESLFLAELDNLLDALQLRDGPGYHILGHSWGGRIAAAFAATQPRGLQRLVLASGIASSRTWVEGIQIIRKKLPVDAQLAIDEEEQKGNFDSARFRDALTVFFRHYFCRAEPFPPKELLPAFKNMSEDKTVRDSMLVYSLIIVQSVLSLFPRYTSNISPCTIPHSNYLIAAPEITHSSR